MKQEMKMIIMEDIKDRIINENAVYIVRADSDFSYELAAYHGFCNEEMGIYILLYR